MIEYSELVVNIIMWIVGGVCVVIFIAHVLASLVRSTLCGIEQGQGGIKLNLETLLFIAVITVIVGGAMLIREMF